MRFITVPAPVVLKNENGKAFRQKNEDGEIEDVQPISLHKFLMLYVVNESDRDESGKETGKAKIGKGYEGIKRTAKLDRLFENAKPGDVVQVEEADHAAVKKIIEEKNWGNQFIGMQFEGIADAWICASEKDPAKVANGVRPATVAVETEQQPMVS